MSGVWGETDDLQDAYRFRTPSLRNVALTGPYGHNGAFSTLEGIIRHHLNPRESLARWQPSMANLPTAEWLAAIDFAVWDDRLEMARFTAKLDIEVKDLDDGEVSALVAFMHALTGKSTATPRFGIPQTVPSGLPVDR